MGVSSNCEGWAEWSRGMELVSVEMGGLNAFIPTTLFRCEFTFKSRDGGINNEIRISLQNIRSIFLHETLFHPREWVIHLPLEPIYKPSLSHASPPP